MISSKIIVALDNNNLKKTVKLIRVLKKESFALKLGMNFFLILV